NQGAQYWAARGLHDLLAQPAPMGAASVLDPMRLEAAARALSALVGDKVAFNPSVTLPEIDGYRTLRREAIKALGQVRVPAYGEQCRPALELLRLMAQQDTAPDPRMDERVEAAIGLARLRPTQKPEDYAVDYAAYHIGLLVVDFASYYQVEYKQKK